MLTAQSSLNRSNGMQRICWIFSLGASLLLVHQAAAVEPAAAAVEPVVAASCPCQTCTQTVPYSACNSPCHCNCHGAPAYNLAPGCCEPRRHCFDNAWDGYCQERAKWDTVWCKVGTGALYPCTPPSCYDGRGAALEVQLRPSAAACRSCGAVNR